jgi:hypothetical protein
MKMFSAFNPWIHGASLGWLEVFAPSLTFRVFSVATRYVLEMTAALALVVGLAASGYLVRSFTEHVNPTQSAISFVQHLLPIAALLLTLRPICALQRQSFRLCVNQSFSARKWYLLAFISIVNALNAYCCFYAVSHVFVSFMRYMGFEIEEAAFVADTGYRYVVFVFWLVSTSWAWRDLDAAIAGEKKVTVA